MATRLAGPPRLFAKRNYILLPWTRSTKKWRHALSRGASSTSLQKERPVRDVIIPLPYGHLAAKQWGPDHGQPVLALHDWFDNAASFEPLVAFLKPEFRIVSLDLTGHGLSSHLPPGSNYSRDRYVEDVLRAVDYLRWDTYAIVGHGMGAGVGYFLGSLQPERVPRLVSLEGTFPAAPSSARDPAQHKMDNTETSLRPWYTKVDVLRKMASRGISSKSAKLMMVRGCSSVGNGRYIFNADRRVGCAETQVLYPGVFDKVLPRFQNSMLVLRRDAELVENTGCPNMDAVEALIRCVGAEQCSRFSYVVVPGEKGIHWTKPDAVARIVNEFLCT
ncbi:unnamed protein product [Ixodes persulcatus]